MKVPFTPREISDLKLYKRSLSDENHTRVQSDRAAGRGAGREKAYPTIIPGVSILRPEPLAVIQKGYDPTSPDEVQIIANYVYEIIIRHAPDLPRDFVTKYPIIKKADPSTMLRRDITRFSTYVATRADILDSINRLLALAGETEDTEAEISTEDMSYTGLIERFDIPEAFPVDEVSVDSKHDRRYGQSPDGNTKIGDVYLSIPPEQISIIDYNTSEKIPIARGIGSLKLPSGKGSMRIELTIEVASVEQFNREIRPLVAQIKRSPWLPIENYHLKKILVPTEPDTRLYEKKAAPADGVVEGQPDDVSDSLKSENYQIEELTLSEGVIPPGTKMGERKKVDPTALPLFLVIESISIQTTPGFPGSFYVALTCNVFNHLPYATNIRYLVDDDDVKNSILIDVHNRLLEESLTSSAAREIVKKFHPNLVKTTTDISKSKVYRKYYQGLLQEYRTSAKVTPYPGGPEKDYTGEPYGVTEMRIMTPLVEESADDIKLRAYVSDVTARDVTLKEIDRLIQRTANFRNKATAVDSLSDVISEGFSDILSNIKETLIVIFSTYPEEINFRTSRGKFKNRWSLQNLEGDLFIYDNTGRVTLEEFVNRRTKEDSVRVIAELLDHIELIGERIQGGGRASVLDLRANRYIDIDLSNTKETTITGINASYASKLVPMPLLGHNYPTYQHMGVGEFDCVVNIQTTDIDLIRNIRFMNEMMNRTRSALLASQADAAGTQQTILPGNDTRLTRRLYLENNSVKVLTKDGPAGNNFLNSLGINNVLITSATYSTVKGSPGVWSVTLTLSQNDTDIIRQEALFSSNPLTEDIIEDAYVYLLTAEDLDESNNEWFYLSEDIKHFKDVVLEQLKGYKTTSIAGLKRVPDVLGGYSSPIADLGRNFGQGVSLVVAATGSWSALLWFVLNEIGYQANEIFFDLAIRSQLNELVGRLRALLIRGDTAATFPDRDLVQKIKQAFIENSQMFDTAYRDLGLPGFIDPDVFGEYYGPRHAATYTSPDFYFLKDSTVRDIQLDLATQLANGFENFVKDLNKINAVDEYGFARADIKTITQGFEANNALAVASLREELNTLKTFYDQKLVEAQQKGLDKDVVEAERENIKLKMLEIQRQISSIEEMGDVTSAVKAGVDDLLEYYVYGMVTKDWTKTANSVLGEIHRDLAIMRNKDKTLQLAKAYPTFKVYFVEEDNNAMLVFDDVYSYDAIYSIDVVSSRKSASKTAVIKMSNLSGALTDPLSLKVTENFGVLTNSGEDFSQDTQSEQTVDGMYIRPGLRVIIKLGYSNDTSELETVFDGAVVSASPGEIIEITCQSWGAELQTPIGTTKDGIKIQREGIRDEIFPDSVYSYGFGDVARRAISESGDLTHFGRSSLYDKALNFQPIPLSEKFQGGVLNLITPSNLSDIGTPQRIRGEVPVGPSFKEIVAFFKGDKKNKTVTDNPIEAYSNAQGLSKHDYIKLDIAIRESARESLTKLLQNKKDDNIWLSWSAAMPWYYNTEKRAVSVSSPKFKWKILNETAFDVFNELLLFHPNCIYMELPYNERNIKTQRSTIYLGPKNGVYLAEDIDSVTNPRVSEDFNLWLEEGARLKYGGVFSPILSPSIPSIPAEVVEPPVSPPRAPEIDDDDTGELVLPAPQIHNASSTGRESKKVLYPIRNPLDRDSGVTSRYGYRKHPKRGEPHEHKGIDIGTFGQPGLTCYATIDGRVEVKKNSASGVIKHLGTLHKEGKITATEYTDRKAQALVDADEGKIGYGFYLVIHGEECKVLYAHLQDWKVRSGQMVKAGDPIATTGGVDGARGAGTSTGPHLHYEVFIKGAPWDKVVDQGFGYRHEGFYRINPELALQIGRKKAIDEMKQAKKTSAAGVPVVKQKPNTEADPLPTKFPVATESPMTTNFDTPVYDRRGSILALAQATLKANSLREEQRSRFKDFILGRDRHARPHNPNDLIGAPGFKKVTRSHFIDSYHHIVSNDIIASTESMWNRVNMYWEADPWRRYGNARDKWLTGGSLLDASLSYLLGNNARGDAEMDYLIGLFFGTQPGDIKHFDLYLDRDMDSSNVKTLTTMMKNIPSDGFETFRYLMDPTNVFKVPIHYRIANAVLANGMREIYQGSLTILMDPSIRPHDKCYLFDEVNQMHGCFEVEEVHHSYNVHTGATTTIVPDLVVEQQNMPGVVKDKMMQHIFSFGLGTVVAETAIGATLGSNIGIIGTVAGGVFGLIDGIKRARKIWFGLGGYILGRQADIFYSGLWHKGRPYLAGVEGARKETTFAAFNNKISKVLNLREKILNG